MPGRESEAHFAGQREHAVIEVGIAVAKLVAVVGQAQAELLVEVVAAADAHIEVIVAVIQADRGGSLADTAGGVPEVQAGAGAQEKAGVGVVQRDAAGNAGIESIGFDRGRCAANRDFLADLAEVQVADFRAALFLSPSSSSRGRLFLNCLKQFLSGTGKCIALRMNIRPRLHTVIEKE